MSSSNIEDIIGSLYDMVQDARTMPLAADKCILERDRVLDMLDHQWFSLVGVEPVADLLVKGLVAAIPALFAVEGAAAAGAIVFHDLRLL